MIVDFTASVACRPAWFLKSIQSYKRNLRDVDLKKCRLFISVNPANRKEPSDLLQIAQAYFGEIKFNVPTTDCVSTCLKWLFKHPTTEYTFHVDDNFTLEYPMSIDQMHNVLDDEPTLSCVLLRNNENKDQWFKITPGLFRTGVLRAFAEQLDVNQTFQSQCNMRSALGIRLIALSAPNQIVLRQTGGQHENRIKTCASHNWQSVPRDHPAAYSIAN
jgi:hypothetical protein